MYYTNNCQFSVLDPNYKTKEKEVLVVEDVEMSPIEILEEKDEKEIVEVIIDSPVGPKKYSKFESDPESDHDEQGKVESENDDEGMLINNSKTSA